MTFELSRVNMIPTFLILFDASSSTLSSSFSQLQTLATSCRRRRCYPQPILLTFTMRAPLHRIRMQLSFKVEQLHFPAALLSIARVASCHAVTRERTLKRLKAFGGRDRRAVAATALVSLSSTQKRVFLFRRSPAWPRCPT